MELLKLMTTTMICNRIRVVVVVQIGNIGDRDGYNGKIRLGFGTAEVDGGGVVGSSGVLRRVESTEPDSGFLPWVSDLGGESAPWPLPNAPVPNPLVFRRRGRRSSATSHDHLWRRSVVMIGDRRSKIGDGRFLRLLKEFEGYHHLLLVKLLNFLFLGWIWVSLSLSSSSTLPITFSSSFSLCFLLQIHRPSHTTRSDLYI